jgi:hypothetical protein
VIAAALPQALLQLAVLVVVVALLGLLPLHHVLVRPECSLDLGKRNELRPCIFALARRMPEHGSVRTVCVGAWVRGEVRAC